MGKTLLFLIMLSAKLAFGQVHDAFDDGDFSQNPTWIGHDKLFKVNIDKELQTVLSSSAQNISLATINLLSTNVKWEFDLRLAFDPSTTNQVKIYLISNKSDLSGPLEGYFIQVGEAGSEDSYDLYRQNGTTITKIIDGPAKKRLKANLLTAKLRITRDHLGKWQLFTATDGNTNYVLEGGAVDLGLTNCSWFGINCKYTATRSAGFFFDNFVVEELVPDTFSPELINVKVIDENHLEATFSKPLALGSALMVDHYSLSGMGSPAQVEATVLPHVFRLTFSSALATGNYHLVTNGLKDLGGNVQTSPSSFSFSYVTPYSLALNDLLITEVMFNPKVGEVDFVEIYNNTNHLIDLKSLKLANIDSKGMPANIKSVTLNSVYILPNSYWVLTTNPKLVRQSYFCRYPDQFIQMTSLPAYNNDKGTVILLTDQSVIDRFDYNEKMHTALLKNPDGVSLERISLLKPTNEAGNFTSAAMDVGFATPTSKNSAARDELTLKNNVSLPSHTFSPDGDGFEDLLQIDYQFVAHGNFANVNIYTDRGVLVRRLQRNTSISTSGSFSWDGLNEAGKLSKVGIYIIKFDAFALDGAINSFKKTCVLATKLN